MTTPTRRAKPLPIHRCRFPNWSPAPITSLTLTPPSFNTNLLNFTSGSEEGRGVLGVARGNGDVELYCWGGFQGWVAWRTLPSSFPLPSSSSSTKKKPSLLSHLLFTHQTTLSPSDLLLYSNDLEGATQEVKRLEREGVRLFGVGGVGSELVEWEWGGPGASKEVGRVKSTLPTLPPIFALASSRSSSFLAIGCEDSSIRILNILDDELELISRIEVGGPGKVRALSLAWGPPLLPTLEEGDKGKDREEEEPVGLLPSHFATPIESYLIAGCSNSSIRKYLPPSPNSSNNHWQSIQRMTLDQLKGEQTVVWSLVILADGTIVSGDSMGNVKFWDGEMGIQLQSFRSHKADVLCLVVGSDGTSIFTSGVDQKTIEFKLVKVSKKNAASSTTKWVQSSGRRLHSHDVRSLIISPPYLIPLPSPSPSSSNSNKLTIPITPILTSGGLDLNLIVVCCSPSPFSSSTYIPTPLIQKNPVSESSSTEFESTTHRRASYVPQRNLPFSTTTSTPGNGHNGSDNRFLVLKRERSIGIWKLDDPRLGSTSANNSTSKKFELMGLGGEEGEGEGEGEGETGWKKVLEMDLKLQTNLISSAISQDGKWLAVSDLFETKLFRLSFKNEELIPKRQKTFSTFLSNALPPSLGTGSSCLLFTKDSTRLILTTSFGSTIVIVELPSSKAGGEEEFKVMSLFGQHGVRGSSSTSASTTANNSGREIKGLGKKGEDVEMNDLSDSDQEADVEMLNPKMKVGDKPATIVTLGLSEDGKWLASADLERKVCLFDLVLLKHHTTLPTPTSVPTSLTFLPLTTTSPSPILLIGLPTNSISLYSVFESKFLNWSLPLASLNCNTLMDLREPLIGVNFEPRLTTTNSNNDGNGNGEKNESMTAIFWGSNWVARIDLDQLKFGGTSSLGGKLPTKKSNSLSIRREADKKRAREEEGLHFVPDHQNEQGGEEKEELLLLDIKITRRYQPLVLLDFIGMNELIVVEKTWFDLAKDLPEAWVKSGEFGT